MGKEQTRIVCPVCGMSRIDSSFKRNDEGRYGNWTEDNAIIQIRDAPGGKASNVLVGTGKYRKTPGKGFPIIATFKVDEAKDMPEYSGHVDQISEQLLHVLKVFYKNNLVTDEDLDSIKEVVR